MAKNIEMNYYNGSAYEALYPNIDLKYVFNNVQNEDIDENIIIPFLNSSGDICKSSISNYAELFKTINSNLMVYEGSYLGTGINITLNFPVNFKFLFMFIIARSSFQDDYSTYNYVWGIIWKNPNRQQGLGFLSTNGKDYFTNLYYALISDTSISIRESEFCWQSVNYDFLAFGETINLS